MNYILMPSLEHTALVRIGVTLWNQDDIMTRITDYSCLYLRNERKFGFRRIYDESNEWLEIRKKVLEKVTLLKLPVCFQEKLFGIVKPLGLELLNWIRRMLHVMKYNEHIDGKSYKLPNNACWTSVGKVDEKKSAEVLVKDRNIPVAARYVLACHYCLEDDVRELWNSVPESMKTHFYSEELDYNSDKPVEFWTHYLKGELDKLTHKIRDSESREMSPYEYGFKFTTYDNNKAATEYFWKKLNPVEREVCLIEFRWFGYQGDVLCFLLSQMNEKEQMIFFRNEGAYILDTLKCFLEWPLQHFFKETFVTVCKLDILPEPGFYILLDLIMMKISEGPRYKDYNYQELLEQIWRLSPEICKEYVFREWAETGGFDPLLYKMAYEGNIMVILKDATIQTREKIIFSHKSCIISLIYENKWDQVKLLIRECIPSAEMMMQLKDQLTTEFKESILELKQDAQEKFNQLIDELMNKKRSLEEGEYS